MIQRTVLIKFAETTTQEQLQEVVTRFKTLNKLPGIVDLQAGINIGDRNKEFQVMLLVRFEDLAALDAYVVNEEHQAIAAYIKEVGRLDSVGVDIEI
ncbi:Dabb family protein [Anaerobacillus isosaccharinicus]|uniref:Dabb family protein n=1 Tax=Anaerobacillus isosaccharinicus TaxID=1532552 RepID=A0A1S2KZ08_9BACI|nr:Dabb family protein [Anaerobacillus isosaccharinicus]MBA5586859.1 Dabb family protein [Anaerobacillus isosaccharinicus]QOY34929.1 Dabb family protein [Anaerobacillus isosaccharinicus]